MFRLKKQFKFEASHQLIGHDGKCARLHGHSWVGYVVLEGKELIQQGPKAGMLYDYGEISKILKPLVDQFLDHQHLNETLDTDRPTSEFVAQWVYIYLETLLRPLLVAVEIQETCTSGAEYRK